VEFDIRVETVYGPMLSGWLTDRYARGWRLRALTAAEPYPDRRPQYMVVLEKRHTPTGGSP
jgi:hypothetical protein